MRFRRLLAGLLSASFLAVPTAVATAPAAAANEQLQTQVVIDPGQNRFVYNSTVWIEGDVLAQYPDGHVAPVTDGTLQLQRQLKGQTAWRTLVTEDYTSSFTFATTALANATYRVVYSGGTWTDESATPETVYDYAPAATSKGVWVARNLNAKPVRARTGRWFIQGNVNPGWDRKYVKLERRTCKTCAWKFYSRKLTSSTGAYRLAVSMPSGSRVWNYRVSVPATTTHLRSLALFTATSG